MLKEEEKQQVLCPLSPRKSSVLRTSTFISEKILIDIKTIMWQKNAEIVEKEVKCVKCVAVVFEQNLAFELFECHFERKFDWQCLIMNQQVQKIVKGKTETAHCATTVFQQKLGFQVLGFFSRLIYNKIDKIKWLIFEEDSFYVNDSQSNCGSRRNFNAFFRVLKDVKIVSAFRLR